ncbi:hypothetical protein BGX38DRAFT_62567 [Terfezia claveryi]|nr:hypothetical protein BGX38DRAFT_62567 [Terfezia claveryi]
MGGRKKKDSRSKPAPDRQLVQSSPTTPLGRLWDTLRGRSPSTSRKRGSNTTDQPTVTTSSQSLAVPASALARPHSSYSDSSALQTQRPLLSLPTDAGGSPAPGAQGSSTISVTAPIVQISHCQSKPIASEIHTPSSTYGSNIPTSSCQAQASAKIVVQAASPPQTKSVSQVWAKALELAGKKLNDNNLPPLNLTNLTSQSAEDNIEAVVKALNTVQEDDKRKRWSYTWRGKEVVVLERLGKILKNLEQYTKVVDTAIQSNPQVALNHVEAIEGFEVAIAALLEKMSICEFYAGYMLAFH